MSSEEQTCENCAHFTQVDPEFVFGGCLRMETIITLPFNACHLEPSKWEKRK